jgi:hypothetical protein
MRRILLLAFCAWLPAASARPINEDVEMFRRESDVIVIGHVLAVKETTDETTLPGLMPPIRVLGVDTTFRAESVLKGELTNTVFVVHHYRPRDASIIYFNGPLLIKFNRANRVTQTETAKPNTGQTAAPTGPCRILALDGGGAKGFYTIGVLREIEGIVGVPLCERFQLIFGTSTGAIVAALLGLGYKVDAIHELYKKHVPTVMRKRTASGRTRALQKLAKGGLRRD